VRAKADDADLMDDLQPADVGAKFAAGMRIPAWSHALFLELRYSQAIRSREN
jgi:hypothetical protein